VRQQTLLLLGGLAAAGGLYLWNRAREASGDSSATDVLGAGLGFLDVASSRLNAIVQSRGYRNNNPGNLRFLTSRAWNGQVSNDGGYGVYDTPASGTRALGKQLLSYAGRGFDTVRDIISTWAPPAENDTGSYVADVASQLDIDPDVPLDVSGRLAELAAAIAKHENGYLDGAYNWQWVYLP
jgi:hypothetical protein